MHKLDLFDCDIPPSRGEVKPKKLQKANVLILACDRNTGKELFNCETEVLFIDGRTFIGGTHLAEPEDESHICFYTKLRAMNYLDGGKTREQATDPFVIEFKEKTKGKTWYLDACVLGVEDVNC